jgi:hypothetical protein
MHCLFKSPSFPLSLNPPKNLESAKCKSAPCNKKRVIKIVKHSGTNPNQPFQFATRSKIK